jgi:rhomboid protease GluP
MNTALPVQRPPAPPRPTPWSARLQRAPITFGVIAVTGAVFLLQIVGTAVFGYDLVLGLGLKANDLILAGQLWRLVTPIFIHAGLVHLGVNMYSLFALGPPVERFFGTPRMLALYLLSGISGVVFSLAFTPGPSVGASGAIFGLLGALAMFLYLHRRLFGQLGRMQLQQLILVGALNLAYGASNPGIDLWGHIGGLAAGAACAAYFGPRLAPQESLGISLGLTDQRPWPEVLPRVAVAVLAIGGLTLLGMIVASGG